MILDQVIFAGSHNMAGVADSFGTLEK